MMKHCRPKASKFKNKIKSRKKIKLRDNKLKIIKKIIKLKIQQKKVKVKHKVITKVKHRVKKIKK